MKARKMSKKMPFSGQKIEERQKNILQWNAGGLSNPKMTEIKKPSMNKTVMFLSSKKLMLKKRNH